MMCRVLSVRQERRWLWRKWLWGGWRTASPTRLWGRSRPCRRSRTTSMWVPEDVGSEVRGQRLFTLIPPPPPPRQVVKLKDVFPHGTGFVLVFDFMLSDLSEVIRNSQRPLTPAQVKGYMMMLLKGVAFLHHNNIMHRVRNFRLCNTLSPLLCSQVSSSSSCCVEDVGLVFTSVGTFYQTTNMNSRQCVHMFHS